MEQGYNHNVEYRSLLFHVQTEDSGKPGLALRTHLFFEGRILTSNESEYAADTPSEGIQTHMQEQHKAMIAMLMAGEFDSIIQEAGLELVEHTWPVEVPDWLSKRQPPTFLKARPETNESEQPDVSVMKATIDECKSSEYAPEEADGDALADVINAALLED